MKTEVPSPAIQSTAVTDQMQLLMAAANVAANSIVITDRQARILWTNPAFSRLTGYTREEALGQNPRILRSGAHDREFYRNLWDTLLAGNTWKGELINRRKDGSLYAEEMTVSPVTDSAGEITNFIAIKQEISQRKVAEEALRQSECRYRDILDNSHDLIHAVDPDGRFLFVNRAWKAALGYTDADLAHLTIFEVVEESFKQECERKRQQLFRGEEIGQISATFVGKQGQHILVEGQVSCRFDWGRPESTLGIFRDVTAHRQSEAERQRLADQLWEQHEQMAAILNSLSEGVHVTGADGTIIYENPAAAAMLGYAESELIGKPAHETLHHTRADGSPYPKSDCRIGAVSLNLACQRVSNEVFWRKDGTSFPVEYTAAPLRNKLGHVIGTTTAFNDVTARKEAEAALRAAVELAEARRAAAESSASLANSVSRAANALIISTDLQGTITSLNPMAEEAMGWSAEELVGKGSPAIFTDPQEVAARAAELSAELGYTVEPGFDVFVLKTRRFGSEQREWTVVCKDGRRIPALLSLSALRDRDGIITGYIGVAVDITLQKQAEAALRESQRAAEDAMRAKSEFTANMSHEIRTPVNGILGMTELALQTELTAEQRDYLTAVQISAESLLTVINEVLDFSKLEAGKFTIDPMPFDVRELLGDTMKIVASQAHQKNLELGLDVAPDVPAWIVSDPTRIRQCIVNLVTNGVKFTQSGEVVTRVAVEWADPDGVDLHFSVRDTGMGIPPSDLDKIFEAYTQADGSMTRRFGGTGLGLTITAQIVNALGGTIWVESAPGTGSTFHFTLRCRATEPQKDPALLEAGALAGKRVLIVDDNATNRKILLGMTALWKMQATAVESAAAARAALLTPEGREVHYDLILLDAQMPYEDGFALAQWIREHCVQVAPTIMMLSSVRGPGDVRRCRDLGIELFLTKPIKQSELQKAVLTLLGGAAAEPEAQDDTPAPTPLEAQRILLAEDNAINQRLAQRMLENLGMEVVIAGDGCEALELWSKQAFSAIFMDVQMPVMDGLEVTRTIRASEAGSRTHIPIIAMTAHVMEGDEQRCLDAGMDAYISKPIRQEDLARALQAIWARELTAV